MDEVCQWLTHLALYQNLGLVEAQGDGCESIALGPCFVLPFLSVPSSLHLLDRCNGTWLQPPVEAIPHGLRECHERIHTFRRIGN